MIATRKRATIRIVFGASLFRNGSKDYAVIFLYCTGIFKVENERHRDLPLSQISSFSWMYPETLYELPGVGLRGTASRISVVLSVTLRASTKRVVFPPPKA